MTLDPEPLSSELPYPPAVSLRGVAPPPVADDALLMPPFSRALASQAPPPAPSTPEPMPSAPAAVLPVPVEPTPLPVAAESAPLPVAAQPDQLLANEVAGRLERMADQLRRQGFHALLEARSEREPIDVVLASVIAGFLARR